MISRIHHVAIAVQDFEWYVSFFTDVFNMTVERTAGEVPKRQLWFAQGVQIVESADDRPVNGPAACDHISIGVDNDPEEAASLAIAHGCSKVDGKGAHWFALPNGVLMEMKPLR